jgi:hypothetical protein
MSRQTPAIRKGPGRPAGMQGRSPAVRSLTYVPDDPPLKRPMRLALANLTGASIPRRVSPAEYRWPFLSRRILLSREPRLIPLRSVPRGPAGGRAADAAPVILHRDLDRLDPRGVGPQAEPAAQCRSPPQPSGGCARYAPRRLPSGSRRAQRGSRPATCSRPSSGEPCTSRAADLPHGCITGL